MPLTTFSANSTARASEVNANFALCVLTDTARTITVTHTYTASQTFTGGATAAATITSTVSGGSSSSAFIISSTLPSIMWVETDAGADAKAWAWTVSGEAMQLLAIADDYTTFSSVFSVARSGSAAGAVTLGAGQLKFPATQNVSADANTLDDYEEGTWTPVLNFGGATTGITYSAQTGTYTKIGRRVSCVIRFTLTSKGSATGAATITGLPFTVSGSGSCAVGYYDALTGAGMVVGLATGTSITLRFAAATTCTALADTHFNNTTEMFMTLEFVV